MAERAIEHREDTRNKEKISHIREHKEEYHSEKTDLPRMKYKVEKRCRTALERQVREAVVIKLMARDGVNLLNNKFEYNRCLIPEIQMTNQRKEVMK